MRKLGVCVHGAGWVAGEHVRAYLRNPQTEVVAISSRKEDSARSLAERFGLEPTIYTKYERVLGGCTGGHRLPPHASPRISHLR